MVFDAELLRIHHEPEIAVVLIVIILKNDLIGAVFQLLLLFAERRTQNGAGAAGQTGDGVPAIAAYHEGDLHFVFGARIYGARKALIVMSVSR